MNSIIVTLPGTDPITGKVKKVEHLYLQIGKNLEMKMSNKISYYESDGVTPAAVDPKFKLLSAQLEPVEVNGTTEGNTVNPYTGANTPATYNEVGALTNGVISELIYWQNIPLSAAIPQLPQSVRDALDEAGIKASDIVYGLIKQAILNDHAQGIF